MSIQIKDFGKTTAGQPVKVGILANDTIEVHILSYGATIQQLLVPDRKGNKVDVVLGYPTVQDYELNTCFLGAVVGRYANRIGGSKFTLYEEEYHVTPNEGKNCLHSGLHGFNKGRKGEYEGKAVAVIGDSTFMHSGITSLVDIAYNRSNSTVIVLDNSITGMTGHQNNPANGKNIYGDPASAVNLEALAHAIGINSVTVVDPGDLAETERVIKEELAKAEPSLIIARKPCALLKTVKHKPPFHIDADKCKNCKSCMRIGCPALVSGDKCITIDNTLCVGCGLCEQLCKFDAIKE